MTISDLDLGGLTAPRTRGRAPAQLRPVVVRELGPADLALLASERGTTAPPIAKLRDRHHALARCLARGMPDCEASAVTGYDPSRISILKRDPSFAELLEHYRRAENSLEADFVDRTQRLANSAVNELSDRLDDAPEELSVQTLLEVAKFAAGHSGHAPVQRSNVNLNVNAGLGDRLAAAAKRLAQAQAQLSVQSPAAGAFQESAIDAEFSEVADGHGK